MNQVKSAMGDVRGDETLGREPRESELERRLAAARKSRKLRDGMLMTALVASIACLGATVHRGLEISMAAARQAADQSLASASLAAARADADLSRSQAELDLVNATRELQRLLASLTFADAEPVAVAVAQPTAATRSARAVSRPAAVTKSSSKGSANLEGLDSASDDPLLGLLGGTLEI